MLQFTVSRLPRVVAGAGALSQLPSVLVSGSWSRIALIHGSHGFASSEDFDGLLRTLSDAGVTVFPHRYDRLSAHGTTFHEATPVVVDSIAQELRQESVDAVVALGGGSAVDTGKAVSAAVTMPGSIADYLEGVGTMEPSGSKLPFVAVPTTAGTGSEATKNAVLSEVGEGGYKKSLRHDAFIPDVAILDPLVQLSCPRTVTAASGLDAITQLLEAYLSTGASPFTDALAHEGLKWAGRSFLPAVERGDSDPDARAGMAYAAYLSGICLANAGLGVIHGLAGPAGAHVAVPHGLFCGVLLPIVTEGIAGKLYHCRDGAKSLGKLSSAADALTGQDPLPLERNIGRLVGRLREFVRVAALPGLKEYGLTSDLSGVVASEGNNKNSPVEFSEAERANMVRAVL